MGPGGHQLNRPPRCDDLSSRYVTAIGVEVPDLDHMIVVALARAQAGEVGGNGFMFVIGGLETTRNAISGEGMLQLIRNPEQMRLLHANRALLPWAIEEIVRWTNPDYPSDPRGTRTTSSWAAS